MRNFTNCKCSIILENEYTIYEATVSLVGGNTIRMLPPFDGVAAFLDG